MAIEVLAKTEGSPNWNTDPIAAVFMLIHNESAQISEQAYRKVKVMILNKKLCPIPPPLYGTRCNVDLYLYAKDEFQLFS
jgi:hypothetical protein